MYPTILVPLDDSDQSRRVLPYASRLAAAGHGRLVLMQAIQHSGLRRCAEDYLNHIDEELARQLVLVETVIREGDAGRQIIEAADQLKPDLIAMATDKSTDLDRWLNGSVVDCVLRHTSTPLLVIPPNCAGAWQDELTPGVLVPLDGSLLAEEALAPAAALAKLLNSQVSVLRVVDSSPTHIAAAEAYVDTLVAHLITEQVRATGQVIVGEPTSAIAQAASGLVAMGTHGRTALARLALGSVATRVLYQAAVPVVLVRPAALRQASAEPAESSLERSPFLIVG